MVCFVVLGGVGGPCGGFGGSGGGLESSESSGEATTGNIQKMNT